MLIRAEPEFIKRVATHPRNWPFMAEGNEGPETFAPVPGRVYLAYEDHGFVAADRALGRYSWLVHIAMLPKTKGVAEFCQETLCEFSYLMDVRKYIAAMGEDVRASRMLVKRLGFKQEGRLTKVLNRNGKYIDLLLFGLTVNDSSKP